jgi:hypothetical protein
MDLCEVRLLQRTKPAHWIQRVGAAVGERFWLVEVLLIGMIFIIRAVSSN